MRIKKELHRTGMPKADCERLYLRMVHHDRLRRARALAQAIMGWRPA